MQIGEWLGFVINTIAMTFQIPEAKVRKLKSLLSCAIRDKYSSYRELARIAHVLGAWFGAQFEPDLACSLSLIWRAV